LFVSQQQINQIRRFFSTAHTPDSVITLIGRNIVYDHKHLNPSDKGTPYAFESAEQLLADFFREVDKIISRMK
jgi:hypothetical protein